ncbi:TetR/AcrR family transcriptional regulator [Streptomyces poriticola]|uniref:TetR/AcrR family transcriptional regulator n=1 Tax=Streptomyces poriticola TaxID=3120506 RepID=UPI0038CD4994
MEIARAAARLFVRQGLRATRAEDIAQSAGIAPRTFYRYFATKEEAIAPLYAAGAERWTTAVRDAPAELSLPQALEHAVRHTLTPGAGVSAASWEWVRTLIRLAQTSAPLRKVWAEVCHGSEQALAEALAGRAAAAARVAARRDDNVADRADRLAASPALRFAAATAGAAVRVAVERWAADDQPPDGPNGPMALALANLNALRSFPWDALTAPHPTKAG